MQGRKVTGSFVQACPVYAPPLAALTLCEELCAHTCNGYTPQCSVDQRKNMLHKCPCGKYCTVFFSAGNFTSEEDARLVTAVQNALRLPGA
jgi:hypothetical protein